MSAVAQPILTYCGLLPILISAFRRRGIYKSLGGKTAAEHLVGRFVAQKEKPMFEFWIDTLEGEPLLGDLENVGAYYPDDDVIYMFGIPCRLSSARPTKDAPDAGESAASDGVSTPVPSQVI